MFMNLRHIRDIIDLNDRRYSMLFTELDKRYLNTFRAQEKALLLAQKSADKAYMQLLDTYQTGHIDIVNRVNALSEQMTLSKGKDQGYSHLLGWMFAGITLIISIGMYFIESKPPQNSPISEENHGLIIENAIELRKLKEEMIKKHPDKQ